MHAVEGYEHDDDALDVLPIDAGARRARRVETPQRTVNGRARPILLAVGLAVVAFVGIDLLTGAPDDVSASVVNTGTSANPSYQLVLSSRSTGEDGRITNIFSDVSGSSESLTINYVAPDSEGVAQSDNNIT